MIRLEASCLIVVKSLLTLNCKYLLSIYYVLETILLRRYQAEEILAFRKPEYILNLL